MTLTAHTLSTATVIVSGLAGGKIATLATQSLQMPDWFQIISGPLGALAAAVFAVRWLITRLDRNEAKFDSRDRERDAQFEQLVGITVQNHRIIEQNSEILREVKEHLSKHKP